MPSVTEGAESASALNSALQAGIGNISRDQEITFTKYVRLVLPLDGFVFWVNAALVSISTLANLPNSAGPGPNEFVVSGSLHYATQRTQDEDQTIGVNRIIFTTSAPVQDFNRVSPLCIYIGEIDDIRFAFSGRGPLFEAAGIYHYQGDAIYPAMETQIIDDLTDFDNTSQVVSNSLPIWLTLNKFAPLYPSFLVDENIEPPYISVHIEPTGTKALQPVPWIDSESSHWQLAADHVRLTLYGLRNNAALDFQDYLYQFMLSGDVLGLIGEPPIMRDAKRTQTELAILAQKKTFELDCSYYQTRINDVARQYILSCIPSFFIQAL